MPCTSCPDPLTCQAGFETLFPPFLGNVRIENFSLSRTVAVTGDRISATGRAMVQPLYVTEWGPLSNAPVEIKVYSPGVEKPLVFKGKTDQDGRFSVAVEAPFVFDLSVFNVYASLPAPARVDGAHLECGPIVLYVYPSVGAMPPEERESREGERKTLLENAVLWGSLGLIGLGIIVLAVRR
jgi:hypothetical protein